MPSDTAQTRTLQRALDTAGSAERLAELLHCELGQLALWLTGERPTPPDVYLRALDVVSGGPLRSGKTGR